MPIYETPMELKNRQDAISAQIAELERAEEGEFVEWGGGVSVFGRGSGAIFRVVSNDATTGGVYNCYRQKMTVGEAISLSDLDSNAVKVWNMVEEEQTDHALSANDKLIAWPIGVENAPWVGRTLNLSTIQTGTATLTFVSNSRAFVFIDIDRAANVMVATLKARGATPQWSNLWAMPSGALPTTTWELTLNIEKEPGGSPPATIDAMWMAK